jgi:COMPASS component SWD2
VAGCDDSSVSLYDIERGEYNIYSYISMTDYRKINTYYSKRYGVDLVRFTHHNKCILCASKRDTNCMHLFAYLINHYRQDNVLVFA